MDPNHLPIGHPDRPNPYRQPDPSQDPFAAVERSAVEQRLSPLSWPAHADSTVQKDLSDRWAEAQTLYGEFLGFADLVDKNALLSPAGKLAEKQKWANKILPALQKKLDKLTNEEVPSLAKSLDGHIAEYMGKHAAAPTDPNDLQVCSEIRAMIRELPENQRMAKIMELAGQGDRMVLQAVLHAPAYLSGCKPDLLRDYQIELTRRALPKRMVPWSGRKDALLMTRRALDGVIRYIGSEAKILKDLRAVPTAEAA